MQNREELRQKGVEKLCVVRGGKISFSEEGGGIERLWPPRPISNCLLPGVYANKDV